MELSVVMPAYMEYENLRILLPRIEQSCRSLGVQFEIVVVGPNKPLDQTPNLCAEFAHWRYVDRAGGNSYGDAVRSAISAASGTYTLFLDADGSHTPEFIPNLFRFREQNDVVIASRYIDGGSTDNKKSLVLMSLIINRVYGIVLGIPCKDISNSFKLYKSKQLKRLQLRCDNFDIVEEILLKIKVDTPQLKIMEVPYSFKERMFGTTKRNLVAFIFSYLLTLIRLRFYSFIYAVKKRQPVESET